MSDSPAEKSLRHIRVESRPHTEPEDDSGHMWAVSYADLLMVLLSFFVVFFSVDQEKKSDLVLQLTQSLGQTSGVEAASKAPPTGTTAAGEIQGTVLAAADQIKTSLQTSGLDLLVEPDQARERVVVRLPENLFASGNFELTPASAVAVERVAAALLPYKDQVHVTVVGHADPTPINHLRNKYIRSNFDLSALRASRAIGLFNESGWPEGRISAQASSSFVRSTRSLSIELTLEAKK